MSGLCLWYFSEQNRGKPSGPYILAHKLDVKNKHIYKFDSILKVTSVNKIKLDKSTYEKLFNIISL